MNKDKYKKLFDVTEDLSVRLRESYISKFPDLYKEIIQYTNLEIPFIQKVWHWVNDQPESIRCHCGNLVSFNRNWKDGYRKSCSPKCAQSDLNVKEKRKLTCLEKWGHDNAAKSDKVKETTANTNLEKWGFKSTFQNEEVKKKWRENIIEKWGTDHYFKTEDFKIKSKTYYLEKWGVEHPLSVDEIKEKIKKTCLERWGVSTYLNTEHSRNSIKKYNKSGPELEIIEWLESLGIEVKTSTRELIPPYSIDIWVPKFNLAIEFNGLYWHSEIFKDKMYHYNKTISLRNMGIHLIHIWEDDWKNKKEVIKSIILGKVNGVSYKIGARKCKLVHVTDNKVISEFLNKNHIQGWARCNIAFGLEFDGEIVSMMTFGWRLINGKREYELIRFCNKINTIISGAATKLFKYFRENVEGVEKVTTYSDISIFTGNVYKSMGFEYVHHSGVNYWWIVGGIRMHRFTFNKKRLVKLGYDRSKTEIEIMHEMGNFRIWGSGQEKYVFSFYMSGDKKN